VTRLHRALPVAAALSAVVAVSLPGSAGAESITSAKAQAAQLARQVQTLQTKAEVATERYDAVEARLTQAVSSQVHADQTLASNTASAGTAATTVRDRARALYESGGSASTLAALVTGQDPTTAISDYTLSASVLAFEARRADAATRALGSARALSRRTATLAASVTKLQQQRQTAAGKVTALLAQQTSELHSATATVRRLERAAAAAAAAASAQQFDAAVAASGGSLDLGGPVTATNSVAASAIAWAKSRIGDPYVWGATGPAAFDCSGLTQWSYAHAGIALPRTAAEQWNSGPHPALAKLLPGDLLFWATDPNDPASIHHVTIYLGNGMMVAAPHTGTDVQIQPVYMAGFFGATRPWSSS
jgi:cell wall-associated NlpC family hydrolase